MEGSGRREQGKAARRAALLEAARRILETSDLSMRRLAEEAGVAEATPYNLFGSKGGLVAALYADQRARSAARLAAQGIGDPLARLHRAIDLVAEDLSLRPHFHRALYGAVYRRGEEREVEDRAADPGVDFWTSLVLDLGERLRPGEPVALFARCFVHLVIGAMLDWSDGRIGADEWGRIVHHGLALMAGTALREVSAPPDPAPS